ncbi:retinol dehydrogenase 12-like [Anopheles ziemanni]|uniref:retinol dehydrogenase 12-like n=1 Tax=Anopheles coustani TaxID=139045 RepID=UPI002658A6DE|nr:retinol dehydrogenase 12-like [Anopheles coustani]XP_058178839.1 retinol dehydrogenase 12-like [Anopheles ziemanni]
MTNQHQQEQQPKEQKQQAIAITIRDTCTTSEGVTGERKVKLIVNRSSPASPPMADPNLVPPGPTHPTGPMLPHGSPLPMPTMAQKITDNHSSHHYQLQQQQHQLQQQHFQQYHQAIQPTSQQQQQHDAFMIVSICLGSFILIFAIVYFVRKFFQGGQFKNKDIRLDAKVVIITGANAGIGKEAAIECAKRGARVYMGCRDPARMEKARQEILDKSGSQNVFGLELDLASFESIRSFVKTFLSMERRLHVLINNAGVMACPKSYTKEGFEMHFGTNHLGHFLLTNLLLDVLKRSAPSRIVTVSSLGHKWGRINKDDINAEKDYGEWDAYTQSKLCNILFSRHLSKRLQGTGVNTYALHPGAINTELMRHLNPCLRTMAKPVFWVFFKTPKSGAQTTLYCAMEPTIASQTGLYYSDCKQKEPEPHAKDDTMAEWLWNISERLTGLTN